MLMIYIGKKHNDANMWKVDVDGEDRVPFNDEYQWTSDPLLVQKLIVEQDAKIILIGDMHSSFHSLFQICENLFAGGMLTDELTLQNNHYLIALGDIVDRGPYSAELMLFLYILKIKNPNNVFLINGNHEDYLTYAMSFWSPSQRRTYVGSFGFSVESDEQFGAEDAFRDVLRKLPSAIYLKFENDDKFFHLSHGTFDLEYTTPQSDTAKTSLNEFLESEYKFDLINLPNPEDRRELIKVTNSTFKWDGCCSSNSIH